MYEDYSILFVDDEVNILNSLRRGLLEEEYYCHFADSAANAIKILENEKIHVLVTDMKMPGMNGLELLKHVEHNYPSMIKLVLSGYTQLPQILVTINQVDIFNFITKPWSNDELTVILRKALDHFILQEENLKYKALLETQNQSYQNILKKIDDVIDNARKSAELLQLCGDELLRFGKDFTKEERSIFYDIFKKQHDIFQALMKVDSVEKKTYACNKLSDIITNEISKTWPDAQIDNNTGTAGTVSLNKQMLDALLSSTFILFHDDFIENGLYLNLSYSNHFKISMISPNAAAKSALEHNGLLLFDAKMSFIRNLTEKIHDLCHITLQILNKDGNLVIGFSFEEQ